MAIKSQSNYKNTPFDLDEVLYYNQSYFDKTRLELEVTAKDKKGGTSSEDHLVRLYTVDDIVKIENAIQWNFTNFSNVNIQMKLEIVDEKRNIVAVGELKEHALATKDAIMRDMTINFDLIPNGTYFYRIRTFCEAEGWNEYYPTKQGVLFEIDHYELGIKEKTIEGTFRYEGKWLMDKVKAGEEHLVDPYYIRDLINTMCSPMNNRVFALNTAVKGSYYVKGKHDAYAQENSFGLHDVKLQFTMDDINELISDKYKMNAYVDGKKIFFTDVVTQQKLDGISRAYIQESDIPKDNSEVELETFRSHVIDSEEITCRYLLQTEEDVRNLYNDGILIKSDQIGSFHRSSDFSVFVKFKNSNFWKRVNPFRTKIAINFMGEKRYGLRVIIKDNYIPNIGNEIMIITNNIMNSMFYKTDAFNKLANYYQVPCYFVPVSHITSNGEVMTEFFDNIEHIEVYANGYRLIPEVDFTIVNIELHGQMPSMILFKDMTHFGSKIEVIYHDYMDNTYFFIRDIPARVDNRAIITLPENSPPFIEGTFTIFAQNKKLNYTQYDIINSRSIILKNVNTRKNVMIKFHHDNDDLLKRYLDIYKMYPPLEDRRAELIGQDNYIKEYLGDNKTQEIFETDVDYYIGLKYVYQLDDSYNYFEQIYDMIKNKVEPLLNANNLNLFKELKEAPVIMDYLKKLPLYFNHHISVNANRAFNIRRFEDNVALFNPGRTYLIYKYSDNRFNNLIDCDFDCNVQGSVEFLTFLNENISLILPYLNNNILIDCNEPQDRDNYKGLK